MEHIWRSVDQKIVRQLNKEAVLNLIRQTPAGISRAEIAQTLNSSRSTVSVIVDGLVACGLVFERGTGISRGGRRPIVLEINPDAGRVLGIDIDAIHLMILVADLSGRVLAEAETPLEITKGPEICLNQVDTLVTAALNQAGCAMVEVKAIGVGVPGPVSKEQGAVLAPPGMPGWDGFPIRQRLEEWWRRPIMLDNDADLGALGEWDFGAGKGESNLVYVKIGIGIGCGLLLNGQIYRGVLGTAGEIGHVTIDEDGPPCTCGNYGCLEAMAGGRAIAQRAQLVVKAGQRTTLAEIDHRGEITTRDIAAAAQGGDLVSQQLLSDAGRHIGNALASLINLLNPGLVLIGGWVAEVGGDFLLEPIRQVVNERTLRASLHATRIEVATLGSRSTGLGAISLALTKTFEQYIGTD